MAAGPEGDGTTQADAELAVGDSAEDMRPHKRVRRTRPAASSPPPATLKAPFPIPKTGAVKSEHVS